MISNESQTLAIVVMGVSGCGKSTVGEQLAKALSADFLEGDDFHPVSNKEKMAAGIPLEDADRLPWLKQLAAEISKRRQAGEATVTSCSALKIAYRDILRETNPGLVFFQLTLSKEALTGRMQNRQHFMPVSLLESQLATLQPLTTSELGFSIEVDIPVSEIVLKLLKKLPELAS